MVFRALRFHLLVSLMCLVVPAVSFAGTGDDVSKSAGTLTGSTTGLSLSASELIPISDFSSVKRLMASDFRTTFAARGTFMVSSNGSDGALFTGSFSGPVTWALLTLANGTNYYTLIGTLNGTAEGKTFEAVTVRLSIDTGKSFFDGSAGIDGGETKLVGSVPEPSTLSMLSTGALGVVGMLRRKFQG